MATDHSLWCGQFPDHEVQPLEALRIPGLGQQAACLLDGGGGIALIAQELALFLR